jgi:hypothetical protein
MASWLGDPKEPGGLSPQFRPCRFRTRDHSPACEVILDDGSCLELVKERPGGAITPVGRARSRANMRPSDDGALPQTSYHEDVSV